MPMVRIARKVVGRIDRYFGSGAVPVVWAIGAAMVVGAVILRPLWLELLFALVGLMFTGLAVALGIELRVSREIESTSHAWRKSLASRFLNPKKLTGSAIKPQRYSPLSIPATRGPRTLSGAAGRGGAQLDDDPHSDLTLEFLVSESGTDERPLIDMIGLPNHAETLSTVADVRIVAPGLNTVKLRKDCAYFIIATSSFRGGAWGDALTTSNTRIAQQVLEGIKTARVYGRLTVLVVDDSCEAHYLAQLQNAVDIVVSSEGIDSGGKSVRSRVLDELELLACDQNR